MYKHTDLRNPTGSSGGDTTGSGLNEVQPTVFDFNDATTPPLVLTVVS